MNRKVRTIHCGEVIVAKPGEKYTIYDEGGTTKEQVHRILDKASQPINKQKPQ